MRETFETPYYRYDLAELRRSEEALRAGLPAPSDLYYSLKANPHPVLVRELLGQGCRPEVSSPGELASALVAGADPREILYSGPAKREQDVAAAVDAGVRRFSVDSTTGVAQLAGAAAAHDVELTYLLRVNPERAEAPVGLAMTGLPSQFGADEQTIADDPAGFTGHPGVELVGLHLYLATNLADTQGLLTQFRVATETAVRVQDLLGVRFSVLDLGGGFGAPYATTGEPVDVAALAGPLGDELDRTFPGWRDGAPRVAFESGRAIAGTCGSLVTEVLDVKQSHGRRVVVLDSGIHHLGGMSGLRRVPPLRPMLLAGDSERDTDRGGTAPAMVCGPLCTPLDTWATEHELPYLEPGDLLAVPNVGAYGLSASLALFLGHPMPLEIVTDGDRVVEPTRLVVGRVADTSTRPAVRSADSHR